jgi:ECF transporter S component (folate family)
MKPNRSARRGSRGARPSGLRILCAAALLSALSIVLGKYLAINITDSIRLSFENLTILMAGIFFGPLVGAAVGAAADLLGCMLVGYAINPIITVGAALVGILAGLVVLPFKREGRPISPVGVFLSVYTAHVVGSMVVKSLGLWIYYATPLPVLLIRIPVYLIVATLEGTVICLLARNRLFMGELNHLKR